MKIMDRYLLRHFLQSFAICFVCFAGLYVVFDAFSNLDNFFRAADKQGRLFEVMASYYGCRMFWVFDRTVGVLALTAAMFTATWIQRHNELTALMAAGISRIRIIVPVVIAVGVIVVLAALNRELVIPQLRDELARRPQDLVGGAAKELNPQYDEPTSILLRGKAAFPEENRLEKPNFLLPWSQEHYARQIVAREARYRRAEGGRPAGYLMDGVTQPKDLSRRPSLSIHDRRVIVTPLDAPEWLQNDQCFVVTDVTPEQLTGNATVREFSSVVQLAQALRAGTTDYAAGMRVTIHSRLLQPLLDMTLLFLGLPLVLGHGSRNAFVAMGLCGVVVTLFSGMTIAMRYLGASAHFISPVLAAWAPLLLFAPLAVEMAYTMRR